MRVKVKLPKLGLTIEEATVREWLKKEGDEVAEGEVIAAIEADKATFEIPSPTSGRIVQILAAVDDTVEVGADIAVIEA
jgi:pyruvate/2-oxoglutarate dehydrogenase complex dihydrolipoamide acyltransferase (E2) component